MNNQCTFSEINLIDLCSWKEEYIRVLSVEQSWIHQGKENNTFWVAAQRLK